MGQSLFHGKPNMRTIRGLLSLVSCRLANIQVTMVLILFCCLPTRANTITAASCSQSDVQTAVNSALTSDTVIVPGPCTANWSSFVTIPSSKGITVNGGGNVTFPASTGNGFSLSQGSVTTRITGFICNRASNIPSDYNGHCLQISGNTGSAPYRIDHWIFCGNGGSCTSQSIFITLRGNGPGLLDHNTFTGGAASEMIHNDAMGPSDASGWSDNITPGGPNMVFVEDNTFNTPDTSAVASIIQGYYGARTVIRHNALTQMGLIDMHGTCGNIGARWWEVYDNAWTWSLTANQYAYIGVRDGSGVIFNNHVVGAGNNQGGGAIIFIQDCSSGSYPIAYQIGRGINQTFSPAYAWGNDSTMPTYSQGPDLRNNVDYFISSSQPPTMIRCEALADGGTPNGGAGSCLTTYNYVPYTYPHPLQSGGGVSGPNPPTALTIVVQ
jgi:hypothetical protein